MGILPMTGPLMKRCSLLAAIWCLVLLSLPLDGHTAQLTDEQIHEIEFHYNLDKYMVGGCIIGAMFGSITGLMTLSGISVVAAVPYIATGCSMGFLVGASTMLIYNLLDSAPAPSQAVAEQDH
jgi:hypothetical protein